MLLIKEKEMTIGDVHIRTNSTNDFMFGVVMEKGNNVDPKIIFRILFKAKEKVPNMIGTSYKVIMDVLMISENQNENLRKFIHCTKKELCAEYAREKRNAGVKKRFGKEEGQFCRKIAETCQIHWVDQLLKGFRSP
jgi:hypothetical protein